MVGKLHIGTSGWSYRDWINVFYPKSLASTDWLSYYAIFFDCTEINSSFYRLPSRETVIDWMSRVPRHFLFCPKMSRYLSHFKKLKDPREPLARFFHRFEPLKAQMGPVLIQLPAIVSFDPNVAEPFYHILNEKYGRFKFALEVRHRSWMCRDSYELMEKYQIAFVISHSGDYFAYAESITSKDIYFRFHGPSTLYSSKYDIRSIKKFAKLFETWLRQGHDLWIFFNNDWFGYAIENALTLKGFLEPLTRRVPAG